MKRSLESSLGTLLADPLGQELLRLLDVHAVGVRLAESDPYGDHAQLRLAADLIGDDVDTRRWLEHRLWCAQRTAHGPSGQPINWEVLGTTHLAETAGHPTVLVVPMTLAMQDGLAAIDVIAGDRPTIVFGEGVTTDDAGSSGSVVAEGSHGLRTIVETLRLGGMYCTYGDFAYDNRSSMSADLFGVERPMSTGWVRCASRDGTMLLPVVCRRTLDHSVIIDIDEPILVRSEGRPPLEGMVTLLAGLLEDRIRRAPEQWLLLPTLTFEAIRRLR